MPRSAVDVVRPAFQHTVQQLFKPFRLDQWIKLAITGLLAGELSNAGGCTFRLPSRGSGGSNQLLAQAAVLRNPLLLIAIPILVMLALALLIGLIYVSSRMRFVLFDSVLTKECHVRRFWAARREQGFRYFLFQLLLFLITLCGFALFGGVGVIILIGSGWYRNPGQHLLPLILAGLVFFLLFAAFLIAVLIVGVLTKDFVVPQMALDQVGVGEGWRRLRSMMQAEKAGYAGYVGMKILLSIAGAIALGIAALITALVLLIPTGLVGLIIVLIARGVGIAWNAYTFSLAIAAACIVVAGIIGVILLLSVPLIVFFPAYAIHFFAARYPPLNTVLYPPPAGGNVT